MGILDRFRRAKGGEVVASEPAPPIETKPPGPVVVTRSYRAAELDNYTSDWPATPVTPYALIHQQLSATRARARHEARWNDYAKRYVWMLKQGVIGPRGFTLQGQFRNPDGTIDVVANEAFEAHWQKWATDKRACDARERMTWTGMLQQAVHGLATDGEILLRRHLDGPMGIRYEAIDPVLLDLNYQEDFPDGRVIRMGIELDRGNRRLAYHFNRQSTAYGYGHNYQTGERFRVPANEIHHIFVPDGIDALRGMPWLATPAYRLHQVGEYENSAVIASRVGANKMGFRKVAPATEGYTGAVRETPKLEQSEPGAWEDIGLDDDIVTYDPTYPHQQYAEFTKQQLRGVAAGMLVSYPTLSNDLDGVNYTTIRHDSLTERDYYVLVQNFIVECLINDVYADWLRVQLVRGVPIPRRGGGSRNAAVNVTKFSRVHWQGRRWDWVDPQNEIAGATDEVALGVNSRQGIMRAKGRDPEQVWRELEEEKRRGFEIPGAGAPPAATDADQGDDDEDDTTDDTDA